MSSGSKPGIEAIPTLTIIKPIFKLVFKVWLGGLSFKTMGKNLLFMISKNMGRILIKWAKYSN